MQRTSYREPIAALPAIRRAAEGKLPTRYGEFAMIVYETPSGKEPVALTVGALKATEPILVRLHSECMTGDVFGSSRCDCGDQLADSLQRLQENGCGILLYLRQEGRGIGLANKIRAYALQDRGYDTVEANLVLGLPEDMRDYAEAAAMLVDLGAQEIRLLTNNPAKLAGMVRHGITVVERLPLPVRANPTNLRYLGTKQQKMGHLFSLGVPADGG